MNQGQVQVAQMEHQVTSQSHSQLRKTKRTKTLRIVSPSDFVLVNVPCTQGGCKVFLLN